MSDDVELRRIGDEWIDTFEEYIQYGFWPEQGSDPDDWNDAHLARDLVDASGERWGLFADGSLRTVVMELDFGAYFRGDWYEAGAVSSGVTPPEFRRQGNTFEVARGLVEDYRERDVDFMAGWESTAGFWRQIGLALSGTVTRWQCSPDVLKSVVDERRGTARRIDPDALDVLDPLHEEHAGRFDYTVDRTEEWWKALVTRTFDARPHAAVWERDGEPRGYVVYEMNDGGDLLRVRDVGYVDHEAYRQLLAFLGHHDIYVEDVVLVGPENTELFDLVDDPANLDCSVLPGPALRVIDVADLLSKLSYPEGVEGTVVLSVEDRLADFNDGTFELSVADGGADCEPTDADPDVTTDIATLSQLVAGYRPPRTLERGYDMTIHDEGAGDTLTAAFPERQVFLQERF